MTFVKLWEILPLHRRSGCLHQVEEQVYSNRKIRTIQKSSPAFFNQFPNLRHFGVPASRAHDHVLSGINACANIFDDAIWRREINYEIVMSQLIFGDGGRLRVLA